MAAMDVDGEEDALDDTKTGEFAQRILAGVEKLFPNVKRFAAGFDEEQERELEQELEEVLIFLTKYYTVARGPSVGDSPRESVDAANRNQSHSHL